MNEEIVYKTTSNAVMPQPPPPPTTPATTTSEMKETKQICARFAGASCHCRIPSQIDTNPLLAFKSFRKSLTFFTLFMLLYSSDFILHSFNPYKIDASGRRWWLHVCVCVAVNGRKFLSCFSLYPLSFAQFA